ncbi:hypothetical protein EHM82_05995, partial [bacterium]
MGRSTSWCPRASCRCISFQVEEGELEQTSIVGAAQAGATLAAFVREILPGTSWRQAKELCQGGRVLVDGKPVLDPARRMAAGE